MKESFVLSSPNKLKEFVVTGGLVSMRDRTAQSPPVEESKPKSDEAKSLPAPQIFTIEELARSKMEEIDGKKLLDQMADIGPAARLLLYRAEGKPPRIEIFEDPRVCPDIHRGAVIENLKEKAKDVSGWRTREFFIDPKGCLGDECGRCAVICPESAIHLRGTGPGSFHEIDPLACKGCFLCWVECVRTAADCILVDGKTFDAEMRVKHFGE